MSLPSPAAKQKTAWRTTLLGTLAILFFLVILIYISRSFWLNLASSFITGRDTSRPADTIVVESWGYPNRLSLRTSVQLQAAGFGKSIFLTEYFASGSSYKTYLETSQDHRKQIDQHIKDEGIEPEKIQRIFIETKRPVTWNTAHTVIETLAGQGYRSMILVSHWHHSRRSCDVYAAVGEKRGIKVFCKPVECGLAKETWWKSATGLNTVFREITERMYYLLFF